MRWFFLPLLLAQMTSAMAHANDMAALQQAVAASAQRADATASDRAAAGAETLRSLKNLSQTPTSDKARAAFDQAVAREQAATIAELQAGAAARNARQRLTEAVNDFVEQGEAIERAAARAARGEVAPSVADTLACDGPDCTKISAREHAALILMGAVGASFDPTKWPSDDMPISLIAYTPKALPVAMLRRTADQATKEAREAQDRAGKLRAGLSVQSTAAEVDAFAQADAAARNARSAQSLAEEGLRMKLRFYGDVGRAVKRAALLAGDGYSLKPGGKRACTGRNCVSAEGIEAAAFAAIGAADDIKDALRTLKDFIVQADTGGVVFR